MGLVVMFLWWEVICGGAVCSCCGVFVVEGSLWWCWVFLLWCFCGGKFSLVVLGVLVVMFLWWKVLCGSAGCSCCGVFVVESFLWWCWGFLLRCFCGGRFSVVVLGVLVVVFLWLKVLCGGAGCSCCGVFVVESSLWWCWVFLLWCFCGGRFSVVVLGALVVVFLWWKVPCGGAGCSCCGVFVVEGFLCMCVCVCVCVC